MLPCKIQGHNRVSLGALQVYGNSLSSWSPQSGCIFSDSAAGKG